MHDVRPAPRDASVPAPGVTYVMPVLNEVDYLARAVESVLEQEVDGPTELLLALAPSTDGTTELAERIAAADQRVRVIHNPRADIPVGLNLAIAAAAYGTIVRVDAHSELEPGYTRQALATLDRVKAANVGGVMRADGRTPFQRAVARAYNSRIGLGGGAYHGGAVEGPAESAYLGVMRADVLREVGMFDETIRRGEDWELNLRIRAAGYRVWFDPRLAVTYWPRERWGRLVRQFMATGTWRGELVRRFGRRNSLRFFAPPGLVVNTGLAAIVGVLQALGVLTGVAAVIASVVYAPLAVYTATVIVISAAVKAPLAERAWFAVVLPSMHLAWGLGFLGGILRGARGTVDTSRLVRNTPLP
ncbi:glycosyltransferase [Microbacterium dauci]|uniref:Glycosyltransferase n=1 Tax=Microbacterium dauci TaxID=3048008 RepID=A0ABT6ZBJ2_9MICO|nr:glycosyltransferase [Microbacterium sp. LX3-4]MDJ1113523.1 glycosyltransferase [Microbacterium sp. LX3-4]